MDALNLPPGSLPSPELHSAITAVWERSLPLLRDRVTVLERAVASCEDGSLRPQLCAEAAREAHRMAGLLGTFGYPEGTDAARLLELAFDGSGDAETQLSPRPGAADPDLAPAVAVLRRIVGH